MQKIRIFHRRTARGSHQARMGRGIHGLPKVSCGPAMPNPYTSCGRATPQMALPLGYPFPYGPAARGSHGLPKVSPRVAMPGHAYPSTPCCLKSSLQLSHWTPHAVRLWDFLNLIEFKLHGLHFQVRTTGNSAQLVLS
jgi:hypothetical protein